MKYYSSLILFFVLLNSTFAQDTSKTNCKELKHGIQFQIGGLLDLRNFNGYTFSYRYRFNDIDGIRIGILTNINNEDIDITQQLDTVTNNPPYYSHSYNFKVSVQYLHSIMKYYNFDLIIGGGPFISFGSSEAKQEYLYTSGLVKYSTDNKSFGYGLDLILGVEYELATNVVISGEYGLTILNENSEFENEMTEVTGGQNRVDKESGNRDRFSLRGSSVNLGIAVFF